MKILVYGAGLLGSLLAARLNKSGNQVALLARGQRLVDLRRDGIILLDMITGEGSSSQVDIVEHLHPDDAYDWIIVVMGKQHLLEVLPILAAHRGTRNFLLVGNNVAGKRELITSLGDRRPVLGLPIGAGRIEGSVGMYAHPANGLQLIIGELDGSSSPRLVEIAATLENAGVRVEVSQDIDAQLKSFAAFLLPGYAAYYLAGNDVCRLANTPDALLLMARGACEAMQVLRANGIAILPAALQSLTWIPEPVLVPLIRKLLKQPNSEYLFENAPAMRLEMRQLAREFSVLAGNSCVITPNLDRLIAATASHAYVIPEGSQRYPLDWRPVWIMMGVLAAGIGLMYSLTNLRSRRNR